MEMFASVLMGVQVVSSLSIIVLVLLQQGKGADMGSAFGGGSAGSLFGAAGAANFLSRSTKWAAIIFFAATIGLAWVNHHPTGTPLEGGVMEGFQAEEAAPATDDNVSGSQVPGEVPAVPGPGADTSADVPALEGDASGGADQPADDELPRLGSSEDEVPAIPSEGDAE